MSNFKKILVPFDDNLKSIRALDYAAMFASGIGATVTALHIANPNDYSSNDDFHKELQIMVDGQLRPKLKDIQLTYPDIHKIDLQIRPLKKSIDVHINEFANENDIDFIILRSHGMTDEGDWNLSFKTTTAYNVVCAAPCPVFTFNKMPETPRMQNILLPIDMSDGSLYKIPLAINIAKQFSATIHLISPLVNSDQLQELSEQLNEIYYELSRKKINVIQYDVFEGDLFNALTHYATIVDLDLIMIMNRPGHRWKDYFVSPMSERIISFSKIPVVSMRSDKPLETEI